MLRHVCSAYVQRRQFAACLLAAMVMCTAFAPEIVRAQSNQRAIYVVKNDRGGLVGPRADQVRWLKQSRRRVEIRGRFCLSACTMYLGAGDVCVDPDTRFGFHGPSYYGKPLTPDAFEYWSRVLASHYPRTIQNWFLAKARHRQTGYYTILGRELIRHGVKAC